MRISNKRQLLDSIFLKKIMIDSFILEADKKNKKKNK